MNLQYHYYCKTHLFWTFELHQVPFFYLQKSKKTSNNPGWTPPPKQKKRGVFTTFTTQLYWAATEVQLYWADAFLEDRLPLSMQLATPIYKPFGRMILQVVVNDPKK